MWGSFSGASSHGFGFPTGGKTLAFHECKRREFLFLLSSQLPILSPRPRQRETGTYHRLDLVVSLALAGDIQGRGVRSDSEPEREEKARRIRGGSRQ